MKNIKALTLFIIAASMLTSFGFININLSSKKGVINKLKNDQDTVSPKIWIDTTIYNDVHEAGYYKIADDNEEELFAFISENFKMPKAAKNLGIAGLVYIQFVIEIDGSISNANPIAPKKRQLGFGLEEELIRVIESTSGDWTPAKINGKKVRSFWRLSYQIGNF